MPWVPREVYDVMVDALRERGALRASASIAAEPVPIAHTAPTVEPSPAPPTLSATVAAACVRYAHGVRDEEMNNRRIAYQMTQDGQSERAIMATLRDGATLPAWADTL